MDRILLFLSLGALLSCEPAQPSSSAEQSAQAVSVAADFADAGGGLGEYWYQGEAEITHYDLQQNRYGAVHQGEAVMIFVTEDFLTDEQVKNDHYTNPNSTPILKNNMVRKFPTGLYDYSMMTSVFTPVEVKAYPMTLKVTTSSQEWCGHTYMQVNWRPDDYAVTLHSYFEKEADRETTAAHAILEDEIYNRIRMNPEGLPTGKLSVLPSTMYVRLTHRPFRPVEAAASLQDYSGEQFSGETLREYRLSYPSLQREVAIVFEGEAPYRIVGWTDSYPSMFDKKVRTTIARATKTIKSAYWQQNSPVDQGRRKDLGLQTFAGQ